MSRPLCGCAMQLDGTGAGFPSSVAAAIALGQALGIFLAISGAHQRLDLQLHQPLGGGPQLSRRSRSTSEVFSTSVRRFIISSVIGGSSNQIGVATRPYWEIVDDHREAGRPLPRYWRARVRATSLRRTAPLQGT